jgi:mono/diheme cytochrome c family protein
MRALAALVLLAAAAQPAPAQPLAPDPSLTPRELAGRNLFAQHCQVCHLRTLITSARSYGPPLSQQSLGGIAEVMAAFIGTGDSNMPGFKYSLAPDEIGAIVAYIKTLPVPAATPAPPAEH